MPRNNRPGTFFGDWNPEWKGSTQTERKLAQNQYDIEEQLEELNKNLKKQNNNKKYTNWDNIPYLKPDEQTDKQLKSLNIDIETFKNKILNFNLQVCKEIPNLKELLKEKKELEKQNKINISKQDDAAQGTLGVMFLIYIPILIICSFTLFKDGVDFITSCLQTLGILLGFSLIYIYIARLFIDKIICKEIDIQNIENTTINEFYEFRRTHYNPTMEYYIRLYLNPNIKNYFTDKIIISEEDILGYGSIEDYIEYLNTNF